MAESKKVIPKQLKCSTQEVQYAEATIEESPDLRKKYEDIINTYIKKGYAKKLSIEEKHVKCQKRHGIKHIILCLIGTSQISF